MEIYDCCMFYNELDMLELRFHTLDEVIDHFVVCEAAETHSGQPKPYHFAANQERFAQWADKIIYVQVDNLTGPGRNSWERERYHRSRIADGLIEAQLGDWIMVGDVDEIAAPHAVQGFRHTYEVDSIQLELDFYYYDVNHRVQQGWAIGARRYAKGIDPNDIRTCRDVRSLTAYAAGWHFSWFGGVQQMIAKHGAFMHHADPGIREMSHDPAVLAAKVQARQDLFDRPGFTIEQVPLQDTLPRYVLDHLDHYRQLGWVTV